MCLTTWLQELNETKSRLERAQGATEDFQRRFLQVGPGAAWFWGGAVGWDLAGLWRCFLGMPNPC